MSGPNPNLFRKHWDQFEEDIVQGHLDQEEWMMVRTSFYAGGMAMFKTLTDEVNKAKAEARPNIFWLLYEEMLSFKNRGVDRVLQHLEREHPGVH